MIEQYFLDESGNTGDLARAGSRFDFGSQQIFTLTCLGVDDGQALGAELDRLKTAYRVQAQELKASAIWNKPELVRELTAYVGRRDLPLMIEVVDKRFMIAAIMISKLVCPPIGDIDYTPEALWMRNVMAEYLHRNAPSAIFESYIGACDMPSATSVADVFGCLVSWLEQITPPDDISKALHLFTTDRFNDFGKIATQSTSAVGRFLPEADLGKHGQSVWMLPNLSSLTNIYARINRLHRRRISSISLIHDEQAQFDEILHEAKRSAEMLGSTDAVPDLPFADFHFEEEAKLIFAQSHSSPGIQAADVLAGFMMRYVKDLLYGEQLSPPKPSREAFLSIIDLCSPENGIGVNFVLPTRDMHKLGVVAVT